jgi:serine/threonine protein kinase
MQLKANKIIHRDLKVDNILVHDSDLAKERPALLKALANGKISPDKFRTF